MRHSQPLRAALRAVANTTTKPHSPNRFPQPASKPTGNASPPPHPRALPFMLLLTGTGFFTLLSLYGASYYRVLTQPCPTPPSDINLNAIYNATAGGFDAKVDSAEYWSGLMRLRARLVRQAKGDVLEAAAGTGRNSEFYDSRRVRRLVLVDRSAGMLGIAREKWEGQQGAAEWGGGRVRFLVGDVAAGGVEDVLREGGEGYDTVVQTNGLCSVEDPVAMLRNLGRLVRRDGRVLLLEHGRSYYEWVNRLMDKTAAQHAASHGCWWNRDVEGIVKESGLEVVKMKRSHLGTHYWVELKRPEQN